MKVTIEAWLYKTIVIIERISNTKMPMITIDQIILLKIESFIITLTRLGGSQNKQIGQQ